MRAQLLRLGGNALTYGVGQLLSRFISFLLLPLFTRELTPSDYGVTSIIALLALLLTSVFSLGFGTSLGVVYFDRPAEGRPAVIWTAVGILAVSAGGLILTGFLASGLIAAALFAPTPGYDLAALVSVSIATTALGLLVSPFLLRLQFEERAREFVVITIASTLVTIVLSVVAVVVLRQRVPGLLVANLIGQGVALLLAAAPSIRGLPIRLNRPAAAELLRLGLPIVPAFAFLFLLQQANKYVLQADAGLDTLGIYTIGFNLGFLMSLFVGSFTSAWYPFFLSYSSRPEEGKPIFARVMTYYVIGFGLLDIAFFLGARPVVAVMTQPAFHDASLSVGFSAAAQYCIGVFSIALVGTYFAKQVKYIVVVQGIAAVASIGTALVLIPPLGILGAAVSLFLGYAAMAVLQLLWNRWRRYIDVPYEWRRLTAFVAIHAVAAAVALWPRSLDPAAEISIAAVAFAFAVAACFALLSPAERRALREIAGSALRRRAVREA